MRLCFFGDVHGNLPALQAVLVAMAAERPDRVIGLGDLVGWGPRPVDVTRQVMALGCPCVLGNHEALCLGWYEDPPEQADRRRATAVNQALLADRRVERSWLAGLPRRIEVGPLTVCHHSPFDLPAAGGPLGPEHFDYLDDAGFAARLVALLTHDRPLVIGGHDHQPRVYRVPGDGAEWDAVCLASGVSLPLDDVIRCWVRAPAVGGPYRDGFGAGYALIDTATARLTFVAVDYDTATAVDDYRALPELADIPTLARHLSRLAEDP